MTFFESIKTVFRKYADFTGRATRPEFWWFTLFSALVSFALASLNLTTTTGGYMMGGSWGMDGGTSTTLHLGTSLASMWSFAVLLPSLAVTIRRLRDAGHRWAEIFWILLPIAGIIILIVRLADPTRYDAPPAADAPPTLAKPSA